MDILLGVGTLVLVLVIMTLFLKYAPYGKQGLQALSGAACATFLPQAFLSYAIGGVFDIKFLRYWGFSRKFKRYRSRYSNVLKLRRCTSICGYCWFSIT
ncbi:hypothetical protein ACVXZ0_09985 [Staphylococcus aureus]